jgi:hypothetical protein
MVTLQAQVVVCETSTRRSTRICDPCSSPVLLLPWPGPSSCGGSSCQASTTSTWNTSLLDKLGLQSSSKEAHAAKGSVGFTPPPHQPGKPHCLSWTMFSEQAGTAVKQAGGQAGRQRGTSSKRLSESIAAAICMLPCPQMAAVPAV